MTLQLPQQQDGRSRRYTTTEPSGMSNQEYERVQRKTFARWMNTHLCDRGMEVEGDTLVTSLTDGTVLATLLEQLTNTKLRFKPQPTHQIQRIENLQACLDCMTKSRVPLVNIGATDLEQGNIKIVLGMLWRLVLRYQIHKDGHGDDDSDDQKSTQSQSSANKDLLQFINVRIAPYGVVISNFTSHFQDGRALTALCKVLGEGSLNVDSDDAPLDMVQTAMVLATTKHSIPPIMDAEDIVATPDSHSMMTYISYFKQRILEYEAQRRQQLIDRTRVRLTTDLNECCVGADIRLVVEPPPPSSSHEPTPTFTVVCAPSDASSSTTAATSIEEDGTTIHLVPTTAGEHQVTVCVNGTPLASPPIILNVLEAPRLDAQRCFIECTHDAKKAGERATFRMVLRNQYGAPFKNHDATARQAVNGRVWRQQSEGDDDDDEEVQCGVVDVVADETSDDCLLISAVVNANERHRNDKSPAVTYYLQINIDNTPVAAFGTYILFTTQPPPPLPSSPPPPVVEESIIVARDDKTTETDLAGDDIQRVEDELATLQAAAAAAAAAAVVAVEEEEAAEADGADVESEAVTENFTRPEPFQFDHEIKLEYPEAPSARGGRGGGGGGGGKVTKPEPFTLGRVPKSKVDSASNSLHWKDAASMSKLLKRVDEITRSEAKLAAQVELGQSRVQSIRDEFRTAKRQWAKEREALVRDLVAAQSELEKRGTSSSGGGTSRSRIVQEARSLLSHLKPWVGLQIAKSVHHRHRSASVGRGTDTNVPGNTNDDDDDDDDEEVEDIDGDDDDDDNETADEVKPLPAPSPRKRPQVRHRRSISDSNAMALIVEQQRASRKEQQHEDGGGGGAGGDSDNVITGVRVTNVKNGAPAMVGGFVKDDIIEEADNDDISSPDDLRRVIDRVIAGDTISFQVRRGRVMINIQVKVGTRRVPFDQIVELRRMGQGIVRKGDDKIIARVRRLEQQSKKTHHLSKR